jgi:hypothetical protein
MERAQVPRGKEAGMGLGASLDAAMKRKITL